MNSSNTITSSSSKKHAVPQPPVYPKSNAQIIAETHALEASTGQAVTAGARSAQASGISPAEYYGIPSQIDAGNGQSILLTPPVTGGYRDIDIENRRQAIINAITSGVSQRDITNQLVAREVRNSEGGSVTFPQFTDEKANIYSKTQVNTEDINYLTQKRTVEQQNQQILRMNQQITKENQIAQMQDNKPNSIITGEVKPFQPYSLKERLFGVAGLFKNPSAFLEIRGYNSKATGDLTEKGKITAGLLAPVIFPLFGIGEGLAGTTSALQLVKTFVPIASGTFAQNYATSRTPAQIVQGKKESFAINEAQRQYEQQYNQQINPIITQRQQEFNQLKSQYESGLISQDVFNSAGFQLKQTNTGFDVTDKYLQEQSKNIAQNININYDAIQKQSNSVLTSREKLTNFFSGQIGSNLIGLGVTAGTGLALTGGEALATNIVKRVYPERFIPREVVVEGSGGTFIGDIRFPKTPFKNLEVRDVGKISKIDSFGIRTKNGNDIYDLILKNSQDKMSNAKIEAPAGSAYSATIRENLVNQAINKRFFIQREINGRGVAEGINGRLAGADINLKIKENLISTKQGGFFGLSQQSLGIGGYPAQESLFFRDIPNPFAVRGTTNLPQDVILGFRAPITIPKGEVKVGMGEVTSKLYSPKQGKVKIEESLLGFRKYQQNVEEIITYRKTEQILPKEFQKNPFNYIFENVLNKEKTDLLKPQKGIKTIKNIGGFQTQQVELQKQFQNERILQFNNQELIKFPSTSTIEIPKTLSLFENLIRPFPFQYQKSSLNSMRYSISKEFLQQQERNQKIQFPILKLAQAEQLRLFQPELLKNIEMLRQINQNTFAPISPPSIFNPPTTFPFSFLIPGVKPIFPEGYTKGNKNQYKRQQRGLTPSLVSLAFNLRGPLKNDVSGFKIRLLPSKARNPYLEITRRLLDFRIGNINNMIKKRNRKKY